MARRHRLGNRVVGDAPGESPRAGGKGSLQFGLDGGVEGAVEDQMQRPGGLGPGVVVPDGTPQSWGVPASIQRPKKAKHKRPVFRRVFEVKLIRGVVAVGNPDTLGIVVLQGPSQDGPGGRGRGDHHPICVFNHLLLQGLVSGTASCCQIEIVQVVHVRPRIAEVRHPRNVWKACFNPRAIKWVRMRWAVETMASTGASARRFFSLRMEGPNPKHARVRDEHVAPNPLDESPRFLLPEGLEELPNRFWDRPNFKASSHEAGSTMGPFHTSVSGDTSDCSPGSSAG